MVEVTEASYKMHNIDLTIAEMKSNFVLHFCMLKCDNTYENRIISFWSELLQHQDKEGNRVAALLSVYSLFRAYYSSNSKFAQAH